MEYMGLHDILPPGAGQNRAKLRKDIPNPTTVMCVWLLICGVCMLGGSFTENNTNPHSIFHTHTHLFTYTHAVIYTTLSSDIRHYCHRKLGAPSSTGDTRVAWSCPTPRSAAVRHQRARYAVLTGTSQTTRRGIARHETTRIVLDIDAHTCVYTCFSMHAAQMPKSKLKFVTLDKESNMSTLWRREEFLRICSKKELAEKAQDIEVTIPVKKSQETRYNLDPGSFFVNRFWRRRPDGVAINEALKIVLSLLMILGGLEFCANPIFLNLNGRQIGTRGS